MAKYPLPGTVSLLGVMTAVSLVSKDARFVFDLIERSLVLPRVLVHRVLVHYRVVHDDGQAVDEAFFNDGFGFGRTDIRRVSGNVKRQSEGEREEWEFCFNGGWFR
jgi:hypothetical protein